MKEICRGSGRCRAERETCCLCSLYRVSVNKYVMRDTSVDDNDGEGGGKITDMIREQTNKQTDKEGKSDGRAYEQI